MQYFILFDQINSLSNTNLDLNEVISDKDDLFFY